MEQRIRLRRAAQERRTYMQEDLKITPLNPRRWRYILNLLLSRHNWSHSNKDEGVSKKTMAERGRFLHSLFEWLRTNETKQFRLDPRSLSGRHIDLIMAHWQAQAKAGRMSPATIKTYFSFLSTFAGWIGKPQLIKPIECYFDDPKLYQRSYIAKVDKSWTAAGISVVDHIRAATNLDRYVAAALMLMAAFGFRFKEACMVRRIGTSWSEPPRRAWLRIIWTHAAAQREVESLSCRLQATLSGKRSNLRRRSR